MKCWGMWYGGSSYACPNTFSREDVEEFSSMKAAGEILQSRADNDDRRTPCVGEESEMQIFFEDPYMNHDPYPDRIITIGPRGGVRVRRV